MSRTFAAGTDNLTSSVQLQNSPWTVCGWFFITTFTNAARLFHGDNAGTAGMFLRLSGVTGLLEAQQIAATVNAQAITTTTIAANTWTFIAATFTSGAAPKIFIGTLASDIAEASYATSVANSGALQSWDHFHVGNNHAGTAGMTGTVARPAVSYQGMTIPRLRAIKEGVYGWLYDPTVTGFERDPVGFWDLSNATVARNPNLVASVGASAGLVSTGLTNAEEPPVPLHLAGF